MEPFLSLKCEAPQEAVWYSLFIRVFNELCISITVTDNHLFFLRVAELLIKVKAPLPPIVFKRFGAFLCEGSSRKNDLEILYAPTEDLDDSAEAVHRDATFHWVVPEGTTHETAAYISLAQSKENIPQLCIEAQRSWAHVTVRYCLQGYPVDVLSYIASTIFHNRIIFQAGLVMHASSVVVNGRAILFTAPSGTGKSTQTKLWVDHRGATILNDDCPCLKLKGGEVIAYGTPWSGSKEIFVNASAPVAAIVVVEQAENNVIRKLEAGEASVFVLPRFFLPYQDEKMMVLALATISSVLSSVPIYHLKCRPDKSAMELTQQCLGL